MKVFVFDLLPYGEHLDHLKEGKELPWPLPRRHFDPKVAVQSLSGMHKQRRRACRAERRRDLLRDDSALAHPSDDYARRTVEEQVKGAVEIFGHGSGQTVSQPAQRLCFDAHYVFASALCALSGLHAETSW